MYAWNSNLISSLFINDVRSNLNVTCKKDLCRKKAKGKKAKVVINNHFVSKH